MPDCIQADTSTGHIMIDNKRVRSKWYLFFYFVLFDTSQILGVTYIFYTFRHSEAFCFFIQHVQKEDEEVVLDYYLHIQYTGSSSGGVE